MTTTNPRTARTRTPRRQAIVMIAYTFVLSLGAAVPFAVSFSQDARPAAQRRVRCGGYQRSETREIEARPVAADRPETPAASSVAAQVSSSPAACVPAVPSVGRRSPSPRPAPPPTPA